MPAGGQAVLGVAAVGDLATLDGGQQGGIASPGLVCTRRAVARQGLLGRLLREAPGCPVRADEPPPARPRLAKSQHASGILAGVLRRCQHRPRVGGEADAVGRFPVLGGLPGPARWVEVKDVHPPELARLVIGDAQKAAARGAPLLELGLAFLSPGFDGDQLPRAARGNLNLQYLRRIRPAACLHSLPVLQVIDHGPSGVVLGLMPIYGLGRVAREEMLGVDPATRE